MEWEVALNEAEGSISPHQQALQPYCSISQEQSQWEKVSASLNKWNKSVPLISTPPAVALQKNYEALQEEVVMSKDEGRPEVTPRPTCYNSTIKTDP